MKKPLILNVILSALVLAGCAETIAPTITIAPNLSAVPCTGGSVDVAISTIFPWKITVEDGAAATISKAYGVGDDTVTVTVPATDQIETSTVKLTVCAKNETSTATKYIIVTQAPMPYIGLDIENLEISAEGGKLYVILTANGEWKSSCSTAGVIVKPTEDTVGRYTVEITVPASATARTITVDFTTADGATATLKINQK